MLLQHTVAALVGAVVLAAARMPETLRTANAGHARLQTSPLLIGGACGRACQGRLLLSE